METNKIAITKDETGIIKVYYYTSQNIINVLKDILLSAGLLLQAMICYRTVQQNY